MTDSNLMDANCIHGVVWYECEECEPYPTDWAPCPLCDGVGCMPSGKLCNLCQGKGEVN